MWAILQLTDVRHMLPKNSEEPFFFPFSDTLTLMSSLQNTEKMLILLCCWRFKDWKAFTFRGPWTALGLRPKPQLPQICLVF